MPKKRKRAKKKRKKSIRIEIEDGTRVKEKGRRRSAKGIDHSTVAQTPMTKIPIHHETTSNRSNKSHIYKTFTVSYNCPPKNSRTNNGSNRSQMRKHYARVATRNRILLV